MSSPPDIRAQLKTLSIPKDRRPVGSTRDAGGGRRRGSWVWTIILLAIVGGAAFATYAARDTIRARLTSLGSGEESREKEVRLLRLVRQLPPQPGPVLTATGKIVSDHEVEVATKVSGQIVSLHFEQGDAVARGQLLARIEDVLYRARRDQAAAELERAGANLEYQKVNFERVSRLSEDAQAASIEYSDALRWLREAKAQVDSAQAILAAAQKALDDCEVLAPISGVILERNVEVGDFVAAEGGRGANANAQFGTIADMTALRVEVDISELDIARIRRDMPCTIIPDADKSLRYKGHVMWLDPGANYSKATVQVKVRIDNPDEHLRVEGSAQVAFLTEPPEPAPDAEAGIWIPVSACRLDASRKAGKVLVVENGVLREAEVTLGAESLPQVQVVSGLDEGQTIVAEPTDDLRPGKRLGK